jgi:hypothetical protein
MLTCMRKPNAERATAYHEAGHVVAALHLGIPLRKQGVTIIPGEDSYGVTHVGNVLGRQPEVGASGREELLAERRAIVSLAGIAAERRFNPRSVRNFQWTGDRENAADMLSLFSGSSEELDARVKLAEIQARQLNLITFGRSSRRSQLNCSRSEHYPPPIFAISGEMPTSLFSTNHIS